MTEEEVMLWSVLRRLRPLGLAFRRQVPIAGFVVDFACHSRRLVVELDGSQHFEDPHAARDALRDAQLSELGYLVLRIPNFEVRRDLSAAADAVIRVAESRPSFPARSRPAA